MSLHESLSASALYAIGKLNFLPVSVASGLENACKAYNPFQVSTKLGIVQNNEFYPAPVLKMDKAIAEEVVCSE